MKSVILQQDSSTSYTNMIKVTIRSIKLEIMHHIVMRSGRSVWHATNPLFFMLASKNNLGRDIIRVRLNNLNK